MDHGMDRRDFAKRSSAVVGGLMTGAMWGGESAYADVPDIDDKRLVILGLNGRRGHISLITSPTDIARPAW